MRHRTNKVRETAINGARESIGFLHSIGESWPAARHKGDILSKLVEDYHLESTIEEEQGPSSHVEHDAGQAQVAGSVATETQAQPAEQWSSDVAGFQAAGEGWSPLQAGPSRTQQASQQQQQRQQQDFAGSFEDMNGVQIPGMHQVNGDVGGGWAPAFDTTASL